MNENEKKSGDWKMILGGIALILVLFIGIKFVFWGLEKTIGAPPQAPDTSPAQSAQTPLPAPEFCLFCGRELPDSFQWGQFCPWCGEKMEGDD